MPPRLFQICANEVFAKLNSRAAMVRFLEDPEEYDTTPFIDAMDGRIKDVAGLSDKLTEIERELQLTPAYIMRSGALGGGGGGGRGDSDINFAKAISLSEMEHGGGGRGRQSAEDEEMELAMRQSLMQQ